MDYSHLGEFWEQITLKDGTVIGKGRSKKLLWQRHLSPYFNKYELENKRIMDIGSNAGGNLIELAKFNPSLLVGVESSKFFFKQMKFVVENHGINCQLINKRIEDLPRNIKKFDLIFMLGTIYHWQSKACYQVLEYCKANSTRLIVSSQLNPNPVRCNVDWDLSKNGHIQLFKNAGFTSLKTIYEKTESDGWDALTNQWYFEALKETE